MKVTIVKNQFKNDYILNFSLMEKYALLLGGIRDYLEGKKSMLQPKEIPDILMDFISNETKRLTIDYSFAYFGLKKQLVKEGQQEDAIDGMVELMGWDLQQNKQKVNSMLLTGQAMFHGAFNHLKEAFSYLQEAIGLDPNNQAAWYWLAETYKEDGDFEKAEECQEKLNNLRKIESSQESAGEISNHIEKFNLLIKKFHDKKEFIDNFPHKNGFYSNIISEDQGILSQFGNLLSDVRNFVRKQKHYLSERQIITAFNDIIDDLLEWMSIVSGIAYYMLKYTLGSEDEESEILDAILNILGWTKHEDLSGMGEKRESFISDEIQ